MNRYIVFILVVLVYTVAYSRSDWYETPLRLEPDITMIDSCDAPASNAVIHVRAAADAHRQSAWGIAWGDIDGGNYLQAMLHLPKYDKINDIYPQAARLVVTKVDGHGTSTLIDKEIYDIDVSGGYNSVKALVADGKEYVIVGASDPIDFILPKNDINLLQASIVNHVPLQCCRIHTEIEAAAEAPYCRYPSVDELMKALSQSDDPNEGIWEYLDRDIDTNKAILGGNYTLATIRRGDGYDIVYIKGAKIDAQQWEPLRLKGYLKTTIFKGNYDMVWYAPSGMTVEEDVNAQYSDDGAILTLRFPILDSTIRLRRLILK